MIGLESVCTNAKELLTLTGCWLRLAQQLLCLKAISHNLQFSVQVGQIITRTVDW